MPEIIAEELLTVEGSSAVDGIQVRMAKTDSVKYAGSSSCAKHEDGSIIRVQKMQCIKCILHVCK